MERGVYFHHGIEKGGRSRRTVDGIGGVDTGACGRRRALVKGEEQVPALTQVGESIAEVGSEGDAGGALGTDGWHVKLHGQPRASDVTRTG